MQDKPLILFDTDMDTDCDDVGALAMLLEAHRRGNATLLAIVADAVCPYAAPCCEALTAQYGITVPIGAVHCETHTDQARHGDYLRHSASCLQSGLSYNRAFAALVGDKTDRDYPDAVRVYRQALSSAADHSVTVVCVGMLTAIADLLSSEGDDISPLDGVTLLAKKAKCVITMGNPYAVPDFNWGMDAIAAKTFFDRCQAPLIISPDGDSIIVGAALSAALPREHLLRVAYETWLRGEGIGRSAWDLIAVLYALDPSCSLLTTAPLAPFTYDATAKKTLPSSNKEHPFTLLCAGGASEALTALLTDHMLCRIE